VGVGAFCSFEKEALRYTPIYSISVSSPLVPNKKAEQSLFIFIYTLFLTILTRLFLLLHAHIHKHRGMHELTCLVTCGDSDLACQVRPPSLHPSIHPSIHLPPLTLPPSLPPSRCAVVTCTRPTSSKSSTPVQSASTSACRNE